MTIKIDKRQAKKHEARICVAKIGHWHAREQKLEEMSLFFFALLVGAAASASDRMTIAGVVLDGLDGHPLAGASVTGFSDSGKAFEVTTDVNGRFAGTASVDKYEVSAFMSGYVPSSPSVVSGDGPRMLTFPLVQPQPRNTYAALLTRGAPSPELQPYIFFGTRSSFNCCADQTRECNVDGMIASYRKGVDATDFGFSTMSISNASEAVGKVEYWVRVNTPNRTFETSTTAVTVYFWDAEPVIYPATMVGKPTWWHVFDLMVSENTVMIVNTYSD